MAITTRVWGLALACLLGIAPGGGGVRISAHEDAQRPRFDAALSAYLGGDVGIIERTFPQSGDYAKRAEDLERWLQDWDPAKAVFVLDVARRASVIAPRFTDPILVSGRNYLRKSVPRTASAKDAMLVANWHRVAAALLQEATSPDGVEAYVEYVEKNRGSSSGGAMDARLLLGRAIAQERLCWYDRPSLTQAGLDVEALTAAADSVVPDDLDGLARAGRAAKVAKHRQCLDEALKRFDVAGAADEARAEARARSGWILYQQGRYADALDRLDVAPPADDRDLAYWIALFRGRVLSALGRSQDAATSYRAALALVPAAQSAGIGLSLELLKLDRPGEADVTATALRAAGAAGPDPWSFYLSGDYRLVDRWLAQLRTALK